MEDVSSPKVISAKTSRIKPILLVLLSVIILALVGLFLRQLKNPTQIQSSLKPQSTSSQATSEQASQIKTATSSARVVTSFYQPIAGGVSVESNASITIKGTLRLTNSSDQDFTQIYPTLTLLSPQYQQEVVISDSLKRDITQRDTITYDNLSVTTLKAKEAKSLPFELSYSPHVNLGNFQIQAAAITKLGDFLGLGVGYINLTGDGSMVTFSDCKIVINAQEYDPQDGPVVDRSNPAQAQCNLTNHSPSEVKLAYKINYAVLFYLNYPQSEKLKQDGKEVINLAPGETKAVTFDLPTDLNPQVYEGYIYLTDTQGAPQSALTAFRWTIKGPSGRIGKVELDKDYYSPGSVAKMSVIAGPSMDLYWQNVPFSKDTTSGSILKNSKLSATIFDSNNTVCGTKDYDLPQSPTGGKPWDEVSIPITIQKDCLNPKADVKLLDSGDVLAEASKPYSTSKTTLNAISQGQSYQTYLLAGTFLFIVIAASLTIVLIVRKKRGLNSPPITSAMIFFALAGVATVSLFAHVVSSVSAQTVYGAGSALVVNYSTYGTLGSSTFNASYDGASRTVTLIGSYGNLNYMCGNGHYTALHDNMQLSGPGIAGTAYTSPSGGNVPWSYSISLPNPSSSITYTFVLEWYARSTDKGDIDFLSTTSRKGVSGWPGYANSAGSQEGQITLHPTTTLSGRVTDSTGKPLSGVVLNQGYDYNPGPPSCRIGTATTDSNGYFTYTSVPIGSGFCLRGPVNGVSGCSQTSGNYECQVAGTYVYPDGCGKYQGDDQSTDNAYNFTYTCDSTFPSVSLPNPPADTCYKGPSGTYGAPWSNTEPIQIKVDDTKSGTVNSSGISNVSIKITNNATGATTRTIDTTSLISGSPTNGVYSVNIPMDNTSFPNGYTRFSVTAYASDNSGHTSNSAASIFTVDTTNTTCAAPHIQTQNGDVHSQTKVGN